MENDFWERLRKILKERKITHKEFAKQHGFSRMTLECKFNRQSTPDAEFLYKCSKLLKLPMEYLYTGVENEKELSIEDSYILEQFHKLSENDKNLLKSILNLMVVANKK